MDFNWVFLLPCHELAIYSKNHLQIKYLLQFDKTLKPNVQCELKELREMLRLITKKVNKNLKWVFLIPKSKILTFDLLCAIFYVKKHEHIISKRH